MPTTEANGLQIYFESGGAGPRLLFISGTGGDLRNKPNVFDGPLRKSFEVLTFDQRGLGQSAKPDNDYCMADYAHDAAGLLDALGWGAVPVMGVSFGGMVAQELALQHPQKVSRLVLACTSSGGSGGASFPLQDLEGLTDEERAERHLALSDLRRDQAWRSEHPERWSKLMAMALAGRRADRDVKAGRRQLDARAGHDTWDRLADIKAPALLAGGQFDGIAPVANMEALVSRIPNAELRLYEGGHLFLVQDRSAYPEIIDWLLRTEQGGV